MALLAGCAAPAPPAQTARTDGRLGVSIHTPAEFEPAAPSAVLEPAADPDAPPVTREGEASTAAALHLYERVARGREMASRGLCGGAVLAVPEGAEDPRGDLSRLEYVRSHRLETADGRAWVTDEYRVGEEGRAWIANVLGGLAFQEDDGSTCEPPAHEGKPYNVLLHAPGVERLQVWMLAHGRPAAPEERAFSAPAA